jgi:hypothetical protein
MTQHISSIEKALNQFLKGEGPAPCEEQFGDSIHEEIEIGVVPGLSKSTLDGLWLERTSNNRLGFPLKADNALRNFFSFINVHPRDVLKQEHLTMTPVSSEMYLDDNYRDTQNRWNSEQLNALLQILCDFKVDPTRPAICTAEIATIILDNACYGGYPLLAGYARVSDILAIDFNEPVSIDGKYAVGLWDNVNGSGHMEGNDCAKFTMKLNPGDLVVLKARGYAPDQSCGFVKSYYQLELENVRQLAEAA